MTRDWPWWRVAWHGIIGHELTNPPPAYPPIVCRTCELKRLREPKKVTIRADEQSSVCMVCCKDDAITAMEPGKQPIDLDFTEWWVYCKRCDAWTEHPLKSNVVKG